MCWHPVHVAALASCSIHEYTGDGAQYLYLVRDCYAFAAAESSDTTVSTLVPYRVVVANWSTLQIIPVYRTPSAVEKWNVLCLVVDGKLFVRCDLVRRQRGESMALDGRSGSRVSRAPWCEQGSPLHMPPRGDEGADGLHVDLALGNRFWEGAQALLGPAPSRRRRAEGRLPGACQCMHPSRTVHELCLQRLQNL